MEHEYRIKEIEIRNRDMGAGGVAETNPNNINNNSSRVCVRRRRHRGRSANKRCWNTRCWNTTTVQLQSLKASKCKIGFSQVDFLGHTLMKDSICPQTVSWTYPKTGRPTTKKECRSLLGMINFYRRFYNCAEIVAPITELTKNKVPNVVKCGDKQEEAFTKIKE